MTYCLLYVTFRWKKLELSMEEMALSKGEVRR